MDNQENNSISYKPLTTHRAGLEKFRGSSEVPLVQKGLDDATQVGIDLARKGGLHELQSSSMGRALQTARLVNRFTHAPISYVGDGLHPWHLGPLEGTEITPEKLDLIHHLVHEAPDERLEGRGPTSTRDGESFNDFKERTLKHLQTILHASAAEPDRRIGVVTHYRVKKLLDAWMRKGAGSDFDIDNDLMTSNTGDHATGGVSRIVNDQYAGPQEFSVDLDSPSALQGGIYMIRHGQTAFNNQQS